MRVSNHSSRSRYKTPLPFAAEVAHYEWKKDQDVHLHDDDFAKNETTQAADRRPLTTRPSYGTILSTASSQGRHAAIMVDSCLPYQRLARTDLQSMAAELELMDTSSSTSSDERNRAQEITPFTESSSNSNGKFSSSGQLTNKTTPEESPEQGKATLQPEPSFASPASRARRRSMSSITQDMQTRSPIRIIDDSPPRIERKVSQGKGRAQSTSTKSRQQDYQFPVTARQPSPLEAYRLSPEERIGRLQSQYSRPDIPQYSPDHRNSSEQARYGERSRTVTEHSVNQIPTKTPQRKGTENFSRPKFASQNRPRRQSQSKVSQPAGSGRTSNLSTPSRLIVDDTSFHSPAFDTGPNSPTAARQRSQSAAPVRPPLSISPDPQIHNLEDPGIQSPSIPPRRRTSSRSSHTQIFSKRQPRSASAWRPPSVWYENVDGVTLSTRPKSAEESRGGLSIPEIEARDIQDIPPFRGRAKRQSEWDFESEFANRDEDYAPPPPGVGANLPQVRSISPRPARETRDHVFFDTYSRAADDEMPNQRANPPRARRSESISRMNISVPAVIREMPIAESESFHDADVESTDSEAAVPPDVAKWRSRSLDEQDAQMTSRTEQVKSLLGGMMKGLSGKSRKDDLRHSKDDSVPDYKSLSEDPTRPDRGTSFFIEDGDDADSATSRPNTVIWSPPRATGRYSDDMSREKRFSLMSDRTGSRLSGQFPRQSAFVNIAGQR